MSKQYFIKNKEGQYLCETPYGTWKYGTKFDAIIFPLSERRMTRALNWAKSQGDYTYEYIQMDFGL
jgi:hypothetical protein